MNEAILNLCKQLRLAHVADAIKEVPFTEPEEYIYQILLKELAVDAIHCFGFFETILGIFSFVLFENSPLFPA